MYGGKGKKKRNKTGWVRAGGGRCLAYKINFFKKGMENTLSASLSSSVSPPINFLAPYNCRSICFFGVKLRKKS